MTTNQNAKMLKTEKLKFRTPAFQNFSLSEFQLFIF